jgi:hypothetical protein
LLLILLDKQEELILNHGVVKKRDRKKMKHFRIFFATAILALFIDSSAQAQHQIQVDDGAGHFTVLQSQNVDAIDIFKFPIGGGTLLVTPPVGVHSLVWLTAGNTGSGGSSATPTDILGTVNNYDVVMTANSIEKMRLVSGGGVNIGTALTLTSAPFATAGVLHNAAGGLVKSSLIVNPDITPATITDASLATPNITVTAGTGLGGGGTFALGGSTTLNNTGVLSNIAGSGIGVSGATGNITISNTGVLSLAFTGGTLYGNIAAAAGAVTLAPTLNTQTAATVFAGPTSGIPAVPTFRTLANTDLPGNGAITVTGSTGLSIGGSPVSLGGTLTLTNTGVTSNFAGTGINVSGPTGAVTISNTGILGITGSGAGINVTAGQNPVVTNTGVTSFAFTGGTLYSNAASSTGAVTLAPALNTQTANTVFAGPTTGAAAAPTFRTLGNTDLPGNGAITVTGSTGLSVGGSPVSLGGTLTLTNTGVTSNVAGTGINVSGPTGAVTISNTGILGITGSGAGINVTAGQNPVVTNTGVTSNVAGTGINVSGPTGAVTISNTGILGITGSGAGINVTAGQNPVVTNTGVTSFAFTGGTLYTNAASATGAVTLAPALNTQTANTFFAGPASGAAAAPTFRTLQAADLGTVVVTSATGTAPITINGTNTAQTGDITIAVTTSNLSASGAVSVTNGTGSLVGSSPSAISLSTNSTLTQTGSTLGIDLTHANSWTGTQTFGGTALTPTNSALGAGPVVADYSLGAANSYYRISSSANVALNGLQNGATGRTVVLQNVGTFTITLKSGVGAPATDGFDLPGGNDIILGPKGAVSLIYDGTLNLWEVVSTN